VSQSKKTLKKNDALLCIPEKNILVEETFLTSGDMILSFPVGYKPFFRKIQKIMRKNPEKSFTRKIQLDSLGIDVWKLINGKNNVRAIVKKFADIHRLNYKEAELSVTLFLRSMGEKGLIGIKEP